MGTFEESKMKPLLPLLMLITTTTFAQEKLMSTHRILPNPEKIVALEKSLAKYTRLYQRGEWRWKVYEILSGPNAGWLHVEEGPLSWDQMDKNGYRSSEAVTKFNELVAPFSESNGAGCAMYRSELSSSPLNDSADKLSIEHVFYRPGTALILQELILKQKKVWEATGQRVAVFQNATSGTEHFILVSRHKDGWKEKESFNEKSFAEAFDRINGANSYIEYLRTIKENVSEIWSEMLVLRAELSSR